MHFGLVVANQNQKTKTKTLSIYFENAIHRVLNERSNITDTFAEHLEFPEKKTFYTFTLVQAFQNKINKTRIRSLQIFKLLFTRFSTKDAISLLLSEST